MRALIEYRSRGRLGVTLIEVLIATLLLAVLVGSVGVATVSGSRTYEQGITSADVDGKARRLVDRLAREVLQASPGSLVLTPAVAFGGAPDDGAIQLDYRPVDGFAAGALTLGPLRSIRLVTTPGEVDDGLDNNSNGLVDECRVVLVPDVVGAPGQAVGLTGFVREYLEGETQDDADQNGNGLSDERGLCFEYDDVGRVLTIRVTIERLTSQGTLVTGTAETSVYLRND